MLRRLGLTFLFAGMLGAVQSEPAKEYRSGDEKCWVRVIPPVHPERGLSQTTRIEVGDFRWRLFHRRWVSFQLPDNPWVWKALVANRAAFIVVLPELVGMDHRKAAVSIYKADGSHVRSLSLNDLLTEGDADFVVSNINRVILDDRIHHEEVFDASLSEEGAELRLHFEPHEPGALRADVKVDLATGEPVEPKIDRLWHHRFIADVAAIPSTRISEDLLPLEVGRPLQAFPPLAKMARISGVVEVRLTIDPDGKVIGAEAVSGKKQLYGSAEQTLKQWRFPPAPQKDSVLRVGYVALRYGHEESRP